MHRATLLIVTAIGEVGTGLGLLVVPSVLFALLLGLEQASPEAMVVARIAGGALVAIGVICWFARNGQDEAAQRGLLTGVLIYNVAATAVLGYAGSALSMAGIVLWPAVALHAALAIWCIACLPVRWAARRLDSNGDR